MRFINRAGIICMIVSFFLSMMYAADDVHKNVGTSAAQFLKISIGARPAALADSHVAIADDANAPIVNPAGMGFLFVPEIQAMHGFWLGDMYYEYVSYIHPTSIGAFGGAVQYFSGPSLNKIVNGVRSGTFRTYDAAGTVSYALQFFDLVAAGISAKVIQTKLDGKSATAAAADIGVKIKIINDLLTFGLVGQHMGSSMKFMDESDPLPTMIRTGFGTKIDLPKHHSSFNISAQANIPRDNKPFYSFGVEHIGGKIFALRFGYIIDPAKNELDDISNWRAGLGFIIKDFLIDYTFRPFDVLGNTHLVSVGWRFSQLGTRTTKVVATLRADPVIFSPNDDGIKDSTFLIPTLPPEISEVKKWKIDIRDTIGALIKTISGEDVIPSILSWDGKNEHNVVMANGEYLYTMRVTGEGRIEAIASEQKIIIDVTPPEVSLSLSSATFSPNGDGIDDTAVFSLQASDIHGISRWQLNITNQQGKFIHVVKSSAPLPVDQEWDGKDDYYNAIVPNGYYDIQFFAWDNAGNRNSTLVNSVELKYQKDFENLEVKEEKRGLVVSLTSKVLFGSGKAVLKPESAKALDELVELLKSYPENKVAIEGHSDSVGSEQTNLRLSSKRAWTVYSYLVKHGINPKRLKPKGYGESKPIVSNRTLQGREKNRRVEIIILKIPKKTKKNQEEQ